MKFCLLCFTIAEILVVVSGALDAFVNEIFVVGIGKACPSTDDCPVLEIAGTPEDAKQTSMKVTVDVYDSMNRKVIDEQEIELTAAKEGDKLFGVLDQSTAGPAQTKMVNTGRVVVRLGSTTILDDVCFGLNSLGTGVDTHECGATRIDALEMSDGMEADFLRVGSGWVKTDFTWLNTLAPGTRVASIGAPNPGQNFTGAAQTSIRTPMILVYIGTAISYTMSNW